MNARDREAQRVQRITMPAIRASISFSPDVYKTLELIAREKKVSLAWVVREAAEKYIADKWPLLARLKEE
jgi:predicted DNA-binding protein